MTVTQCYAFCVPLSKVEKFDEVSRDCCIGVYNPKF